MMGKLTGIALGVLIAGAWSGAAAAQGNQSLDALDMGALKGALQQRFDAALAATNDPALINGNDPRYLWASEAKAQCGIAIGFTKSGTRDAPSIRKCALAADMMARVPAPRAPLPPPPPPPPRVTCTNNPGLVFFDFDSDAIPADARQTIQFAAQNAAPCGWRNFNVVGHADRSGSDEYNVALSRRRADAVAQLMTSMGIAQGQITTDAKGESSPRVPTADGVREPQNRRVEITVK
jgi:outer membrane protein OmpA-like peptidoglycan-associated protein